MTVSIQVAKYICEKTEWNTSNLRLQKILYIAHMLHIGETGTPLINDTFEAWDYGPVVPNLYHRFKMFGSSNIKEGIFPNYQNSLSEEIIKNLDITIKLCKDLSTSDLVGATHRHDGAWAKHYRAGINSIIPNRDIIEEFNARQIR